MRDEGVCACRYATRSVRETAFVLQAAALRAIQVGMLHSLAAHGVAADMVVGCSVGALTALLCRRSTLEACGGSLQSGADCSGTTSFDELRTVLSFLWPAIS